MKKLFVIAVMALVSSFAFAADITMGPSAPAASVSASATDVSQKPAPSILEKGAHKVGSFFGGLAKGPAMLGRAFTQGVSAGYSGKPAPEKAQVTAESEMYGAASAAPASTEAGSSNPFSKLAALMKRPQSQASAPIEDHSISAASLN